MLKKLLNLIPSANQRLINRWQKIVYKINLLENEISSLDDFQLKQLALLQKNKIQTFFSSKKDNINIDESDSAIIELFAVAREASKRILNMRYFDVQLIGALALHEGKLAEMRTGEGKTLVITIPAILNALNETPVHVVTVNEYLATRDAEKMTPLYNFFGIDVGLLSSEMSIDEKRLQYQKNIVYGVNHEFGFDYLRENLVTHKSERFMSNLGFAIIDEVDSILIDEARTPLIITTEDNDDLEIYTHTNNLAKNLIEDIDFEIDRKLKQILLTENGYEKSEAYLCSIGILNNHTHLYEPHGAHIMGALHASLQAHYLFHKDHQYIIREDKILIVDEFTGRVMADRRWSNGIHQAIEAKEFLEIKQESKTIASVTYQNFFRLYKKLSGLTGTALTQASEFWQIYAMETVEIPTNKPMIRIDMGDVIYRSKKEKWNAVVEEVKNAINRNQPVLCGTGSIEDSETLSEFLTQQNISHNVLNAKNHTLEAEIIAQAGVPKAVTVATNMAGRGTDIVLGGNIEHIINTTNNKDEIDFAITQWREKRDLAVKAGGLFVIGTCRHESRRVDNQLRGRSGRQGDPGMSKFFISLEDDMFRNIQKGFLNLIDKFKLMPEGSSLEHPMLTNSMEKAQRGVEAMHFNIRKNIIDYDDVAADQRKAIYSWRNEILDSELIKPFIETFISEVVVENLYQIIVPESLPEEWNLDNLISNFNQQLSIDLSTFKEAFLNLNSTNELEESLLKSVFNLFNHKYNESFNDQYREIIINILDEYWRDHLTYMTHLLDGIHLRSYAQKDPKREFKHEAFQMFKFMRNGIATTVVDSIFKIKFNIDSFNDFLNFNIDPFNQSIKSDLNIDAK